MVFLLISIFYVICYRDKNIIVIVNLCVSFLPLLIYIHQFCYKMLLSAILARTHLLLSF